MELSRSQSTAIKNIIAKHILGVHIASNGIEIESIANDNECWKHADIIQRQQLGDIVSEIRKI